MLLVEADTNAHHMNVAYNPQQKQDEEDCKASPPIWFVRWFDEHSFLHASSPPPSNYSAEIFAYINNVPRQKFQPKTGAVKYRMAGERRENMLPPKYEGENYRLWVGDALKVLLSFPDNCVHLIVTSPPYYIGTGYYSDLPDDLENQPTWEEYVAKLLDILSECARVLVAGGKMCVNIADSWTNRRLEGVNKCYPTHARVLLHMVEKCGLIYKGSIIYEQIRAHHASGGALCLRGSFPYPPNIPICNFYEYILIFQKEGKYQPADNSPENREASKISRSEFADWASTGIWRVPANRERKVCPAPFPYEIPYRLIKLFSLKGDIVLDPFVGSGTTVYVAIQLGRVAWGIDINETYIDYVYQNIPFISPNLFG